MKSPRYTFRAPARLQTRINLLQRRYNITRSAALKLAIDRGLSDLEGNRYAASQKVSDTPLPDGQPSPTGKGGSDT